MVKHPYALTKKIMKHLLYTCLVLLAFTQGCKKKEQISPELHSINKLKHTWTLGIDGYVKIDGQDITSDYTEFQITFTAQGELKIFEVQNGGNAFPMTTDTWTYEGTNYERIVRGDGVVMDAIITNSTLDLTFNKPIPSGGRVEGTYGNFEFHLNLQE